MSQLPQPPTSEAGGAAPQFLGSRIRGLRKRRGMTLAELGTHSELTAGYILSGSFELWVGERHFQLGEGDSFSFSSQEPHRYGNPGEVDAVVIWVITPPTF